MDAAMEEQLWAAAHLSMARQRAMYVNQMQALDEGEVGEAARALHGYPPV
jgi:hypothetical protein